MATMAMIAAEAGATGAGAAGAGAAGAGGEAGGAAARYFGTGRAAGAAESTPKASGASKTAETAGKAEKAAEKPAQTAGKAEKTGEKPARKVEKAAGRFKVPSVVSGAVEGTGYAGIKAEYVASILLLLIWPLSDREAINSKTKFGNWVRQLVALTLAHAILIAIAATGPRAKRLATLFGLLLLIGLALSRQGKGGAMLGNQVLRTLVRILSPSGGRTGNALSGAGAGTRAGQDFASAGDMGEGSTSGGGGGGQNSGATSGSKSAVDRQRSQNRSNANAIRRAPINRSPSRAAPKRGGRVLDILPDITGLPPGKDSAPKRPGRKAGAPRAPVVAPPRRAPTPPRRIPNPRPGPPPHP